MQVVNRYEEVGSDFVRNRVWIRRDWRSAVYEAGLHHVPELRSVKRYLPLSLKWVTPQILHRTRSRVLTELWDVRAIRKGNGRLTSVAATLRAPPRGTGSRSNEPTRE